MWRQVSWMTGFGLGAWTASVLTFGGAWQPEAAIGLAGPVLSANLGWVAMVRAHRAESDRLMATLVRAMAIKMVGFGVYVALALTVLDLRPIPFVVSFTTGFVGLYVMEAWFLKRLLDGHSR